MGRGLAIKYMLLVFFLILSDNTVGQKTEYVQIKVYKEKLLPFGNFTLLINNKTQVKIPETGIAYHEFESTNLPFSSIKMKKKGDVEVESWHFGKGVLEIIFRPKNYKIVLGEVLDEKNNTIDSTFIAFQDFPQLNTSTQKQGRFSIRVPFDLPINKRTKFSVPGYRVKKQNLKQQSFSIIVTEQLDSLTYFKKKFDQFIAQQALLKKENQKNQKNQKNQSAVSENSHESDKNEKRPFISSDKNSNAKFNDLSQNLNKDSTDMVGQIENKVREQDTIDDNSIGNNQKRKNDVFVEEFNVLLNEKRAAHTAHLKAQEDINSKMRAINNRLIKGGGINLSKKDRESILDNIDKLERLLEENKKKYNDVQDDYHLTLLTLKNNIQNIGKLEEQLTESEMRRLQERSELIKQLAILGVLFFVLLVIAVMAIIFAKRYKTQGKKLEIANVAINNINAHLELRVEERTEELKATNKELDTFFYRASHDLKRPITSIIGLANIAKMVLDDEGQELFAQAKNTAMDMGKMLEKLIMIGNINATDEMKVIALDKIIDKTLAMQKNRIDQYNIQVDILLEQNTMHSYPLLIENLLYCIIENAIFFLSIKKTQQKKTIAISTKLLENQIYISIEDNGVGIQKKYIDKVNDMYFVGSEVSKGNGLGLYVANKIVNKIEGRISIASEENKTTKIIIKLPYINQV